MNPRALYRLLHVVYLIAAFCIRWLPLRAGFLVGRAFGFLGWVLARRLRELALDNLRRAFAGKRSEEEIRRIGRESFCRIGANLLSSIKLASMQGEAVMRCVDFQIPTAVQERRKTETSGWVAMISHLGNWELYAQIRHFLPEYEVGAVYQPLSNSYIDAEIRKDRARFGVHLFDRRTALVKAARFLRGGGVVGVLVDQYAGEPGVWTPFFGRLASTSPLAATLAIHADVPIVPIAVYTTGIAKWRVTVSPVLDLGPEADADHLTAAMTQILERQIEIAPEDWLWAHNRWKTPAPAFLLASMPRGVVFPEPWDGKLHPFRILVVAPDDLIGNVACLRAVQAIHAGRPDARIEVLAPADCVPAWTSCPAVAQVSSGNSVPGDFDALFLFGTRAISGLERIPRRIAGPDFGLPLQAWDEEHYLKIAGFAGAIPSAS